MKSEFDEKAAGAENLDEKLCRETIEDLRHIAQVLELDLQRWAFGRPQPNTRHGMLTHALSQMYFLSASDAAGQPLQLDFVGRLEHLQHDMATVMAFHFRTVVIDSASRRRN